MKKTLLCLLLLISLFGCANDSTTKSNNEKYLDYCELLNDRANFKASSELFDVSTEVVSTSDGYRYYVVIDNVKTAMYNIEAVALEKGDDYTTNMAANIGIFEDNKYHIIPNQVNVADNYVKGVTISGIASSETPTIYLLIQWTNKDETITNREFICIDLGSENTNGQ